jgi:co-chaperonin GroES (HSP10)
MITPIGKRIVVKRLVDKQSGSILIPDQMKQMGSGRVVNLGTGAPNFEFTVKIGDRVMINPNHIVGEHEIDGEPHLVLREQDLLAIMEGGEDGPG